MLRCAACINSVSAFTIAFSAASRSPRLIASSTVRTAPRIWVRRDLLIAVRRAILRVAFLAEVVLAISSNVLSGVTVRSQSQMRAPSAWLHDRRCWLCLTSLRLPLPEQNAERKHANRKMQTATELFAGAAQRTAAAGLRP